MRRSWTMITMVAAALSMGPTAAPAADLSAAPGGDSGMCAAEAPAERIRVLVELVDTPALRVYEASLLASPATDPAQKEAAARAAERAQDRRIKEAQASVARGLAGLGARELYRVRRSFNGMAVVVGPDKLDALRTLPGVKAIYPRHTDGPNTDGPAAVARKAAGPSEPEPSPNPADAGFPADAASPPTSGLRAYLDPTGRLTSTPTEAQLKALERLLGDAADRSSEGLEVVTHADGSEVVFLQGRFQSYSTAALSPGGGVKLHCHGHGAAVPRSQDPAAAAEKE